MDQHPGVLLGAGDFSAAVEKHFGGPNENHPIEYGVVLRDLVEQTRHVVVESPEVASDPAVSEVDGPEI